MPQLSVGEVSVLHGGKMRSVDGGTRPPFCGRVSPFLDHPTQTDAVRSCIVAGVLPLKYAYTGSAARAHDRLARTTGYRTVAGFAGHEVETLRASQVAQEVARQVVEIGPGNGVHTVAVLRALRRSGFRCRRYLGLDFSRTLLRLAARKVSAGVGDLTQVKAAVWDIETGASPLPGRWRSYNEPLLACLLGHTLGNVESATGALRAIHRTLRAGDVLLAGLALRPPRATHDELTAPYRSAIFRAAVVEPLRAVGIPSEDLDLRIRFADEAIIGEVSLRRPVAIDEITLGVGHQIRCFLSRRFTLGDVRPMLTRAGWSPKTALTDDSGGHAVITAIHDGM